MIFVLLLHIVTLLFWCATLLYLPVIIALDHGKQKHLSSPENHGSMARFIFTHLSTPAALIAVMAGTIVFVINHTVEFWLMVKLTLVTGLVISHALTGLLIVGVENIKGIRINLWSGLLGLTIAALITAIITIVLAKPQPGFFP